MARPLLARSQLNIWMVKTVFVAILMVNIKLKLAAVDVGDVVEDGGGCGEEGTRALAAGVT